MPVAIPEGYLMAGVHSRVKRDPKKQDLALILSEAPATTVGVYTKNLVHAAPVALDRRRTPSDRIRVIVMNSGNANACTGERGMKDALEMTEKAALACGAQPEEALVLSTGVIGEYLPMDKIEQGIMSAAVKLGRNEACLVSTARGMLTTDTVEKIAARSISVQGREIRILGMAKGAGMIAPNMATMLGVILTDAALEAQTAQTMLREISDETFNCTTVDGHMSTNDTVLLLANGAAGGEPLAGEDLAAFRRALEEVCVDLAKAICIDGEGATHLITIEVGGCPDREAARRVARTIADSPLVKTAITGADPNWGRIVSAAGYAGVEFDPADLRLTLNGTLLFDRGAPVAFDEKAVSQSIRENYDTAIELTVGDGPGTARFWTTDLTAEYVRINADYRT